MDGLDRERESLKGKKFTYLPMSVCVQTYAKESKIKRERELCTYRLCAYLASTYTYGKKRVCVFKSEREKHDVPFETVV